MKIVDYKSTFICCNVTFDTYTLELITVGKHVHITNTISFYRYTCTITQYRCGPVIIDDESFIGINTIICNSVRIGKRAFIGAGSVVTKDVPDDEIWAGNPA